MASRLRRYWWIVVQPGEEEEVDVCRADPGHPVTLTVTASLRILVDVLMGAATLAEALRQGLMRMEGDRELARRFKTLVELEGSESHLFAGRPMRSGVKA